MRVFANDLEKTINQINDLNIIIDNDDNKKDIDSLIEIILFIILIRFKDPSHGENQN